MPAPSTASPLATIADRVGSRWWILLVIGVFWVVVGFVVLRFDSSTVTVVSIIFGIMVLLSAAGEAFRAFVTPGGWRVWHAIFAVLLVIGAVVIFVNPGDAFVSLALVVGFYFVFAGTFDIVSSLFSTAVPGWWLQLLSGIAQLVLGLIASSSWQTSIVVLVTYVSVLALFRGVAEIAAAFAVRGIAQNTR
ncbi:HdeD family acid-resistance protein [Subtercola sp. YIM 133946]|uniref:HdeD family acid-resistance protein n=1 Tax=Subtercola sp. YIM 133946 TaxID=3118909 RepID=UPI002F944280